MLKNKKVNKKVIMTEYAMALKTGKEIIYKTQQTTYKQAVKYFAAIKQMPVEDFNKIFIVTEIKK